MINYSILLKHRHRYNFINDFIININTNQCVIKKFTEFDNRTIAQVRLYLKKLRLPRNTKKEVIQNAINQYSGWIYDNTLYYNNSLNNSEIISTIIHEYVHWKRKKEQVFKYRTANDIFLEEFFAEYVSKVYMNIFNKKSVYISIPKLIKTVLYTYRLPIDPSIANKIVVTNILSIIHYFD